MTAERALSALPYDLRRKKVDEYEYLYEINDRGESGTILGPCDDEKARMFALYRHETAAAQER